MFVFVYVSMSVLIMDTNYKFCTLGDVKYANMVRMVLGQEDPKLNKLLPYNPT